MSAPDSIARQIRLRSTDQHPTRREATLMKAHARIAIGLVLVAAMSILQTAPARALSLNQLLGRSDEQDLNAFKLIHVADLKALMDSGKDLHIYDANGPDTRDKFGVIPGATLLNSDDKYNLGVLPRDKSAKLVFYCANSH
jgi:hypothetical protein